MIAKIAVAAANFAIDKPYSYAIPEDMTLAPGLRVRVPFGRSNRPTEGVVLSVEQGSVKGLKFVEAKLDEEPVLSMTMLRLAAFLRERCFCTFFDAMRTMLPGGLWFQEKELYALTQDRSWEEITFRQPTARKILELLLERGGEAEGALLRRQIPEEADLERGLNYLLKKKWITARQSFFRRAADKTEQIAALAVPVEQAMEYAMRRTKSAELQRSVLETLCQEGSLAVKELCYFTGAKSATVKRLAELGYIALESRPVLRCREIQPVQLDGPLALNPEQEAAFQGLEQQLCREAPGGALLYGVTGSGKTAVYIALIQKCLRLGKQALLLVPEIALTPQLLGLMAAWFGKEVAVLHSSLPQAERYDQWKRVRSGEARVVVGTRSAVFAPCPELGLIIIDEEQEHSYKSENAPRYDAKEVALWRSTKEKALLLLGSATPSVETMYHAKTGSLQLYTLRQRYNGKALPKVQIVDIRDEMKLGNDSCLSYPLQEAIRETANAGQQTILFLNRRGNSRALVCIDCREAPECPRCSARLTYHSANERLMCHYCGYSQGAVQRCPKCGGPVKRVGSGTQRVQQELKTLFSDLEIDRMDADTVSAVNTHEKILEHFTENNVPVLIGTQMVAKGLNLPNVTLVGALDADLSLYSDSFRGAETTFNMLTQVTGRAGRGALAGKAMIQTAVPEHRVIQLAAAQDYDGFYDLEIGLRKIQNCPPFGDLVTLTFTGQEETGVLRGAVKLRDSLRACLQQKEYAGEKCTVLGPAPCPVPKINYNFRYRLTLRCGLTRQLRELIGHMLRQFSTDRENRGITAFADVNGYD